MGSPGSADGNDGSIAAASATQLRSARRLRERKQRRLRGEFLVEGPQAVREALGVPDLVQLVYATSTAADRYPELIDRAPTRLLDPAELGQLTDTVHPQGMVAIARTVATDLTTALAGTPGLVVICAQVRDPGNAGTVIRCADAVGATAVIMSADSVELTNPKVVRASAGSIFHLPIVTEVRQADAVAACRERGLRVYAADGGVPLTLDRLAADGGLAGPVAWLFGNEAWGLPPADAALADARVAVPIWGRAESLNLASAAAVCLYASAFGRSAYSDPSGRAPESAAPGLPGA